MAKVIIGIDPGLTGAIAVLRPPLYVQEGFDAMAVYDMPVRPMGGTWYVKHEVEPVALSAILKHPIPCEHENIVAYIEAQRPGLGSCSMFSLGTSYGMLLGVLTALNIKTVRVLPQEWKAYFGLGKDKANSLRTARDLFPIMWPELCRKKDHGRAEALLIADYGRRHQG